VLGGASLCHQEEHAQGNPLVLGGESLRDQQEHAHGNPLVLGGGASLRHQQEHAQGNALVLGGETLCDQQEHTQGNPLVFGGASLRNQQEHVQRRLKEMARMQKILMKYNRTEKTKKLPPKTKDQPGIRSFFQPVKKKELNPEDKASAVSTRQ
jgi:hypothetical protein